MRRWTAGVIRAYTRWTPIARGKYRLASLARRLDPDRARLQLAHAKDGRTFEIDPCSPTYGCILDFGEYESGISRVLRALVRAGDVCVDAGANIGWHSTLMGRLSAGGARRPSVHAFEPDPHIVSTLAASIARNGLEGIVVPVACALTDREEDATLFRFDQRPEGHASLRHVGPENATPVAVRTTTLDAYLRRACVPAIDVLKADVEGAEYLLLRGALAMLGQARPPLLIMEMARETARPFGYEPNHLMGFLRERADYRFFRINDRSGQITALTGFTADDPGGNILCVPAGHFGDRLAALDVKRSPSA